MTETRNRTSVIPKPAWILAIVAYFFFYMVMRFGLLPHGPRTQYWPEPAKVFVSLIAPLFAVVWILLIGYIYGDAERRGMRQWLWVLLAIFIPDAIGIILYFILRDPMPFYCSHCGTPTKSTFTFCPNCSASLRPTCTQCGRGLERGWKHCPICGAPAPTGIQAAPQTTPPTPGPVQT